MSCVSVGRAVGGDADLPAKTCAGIPSLGSPCQSLGPLYLGGSRSQEETSNPCPACSGDSGSAPAAGCCCVVGSRLALACSEILVAPPEDVSRFSEMHILTNTILL